MKQIITRKERIATKIIQELVYGTPTITYLKEIELNNNKPSRAIDIISYPRYFFMDKIAKFLNKHWVLIL